MKHSIDRLRGRLGHPFRGLRRDRRHRALSPCATDPGRLAATAADRGVPGYSDHLRCLRRCVPMSCVTTPHVNVQLSIDCLAAGVHVLQEKPLAHTLAESDRLVEAAKSAASKIGICFQNRYNVSSTASPARSRLRRVGHNQRCLRFGVDPHRRLLRARGHGVGHGRTVAARLLINQAIHTLDLIQWLMGDVVDIHGRADTHKFQDVIEVEDTAGALFQPSQRHHHKFLRHLDRTHGPARRAGDRGGERDPHHSRRGSP